MKFIILPMTLAGALLLGSAVLFSTQAAELIYARDGSGVYGYKDTPKLPWCPYLVHDPDRPAPRRVDPGKPGAGEFSSPPSDAVVLFDGHNLDPWEANRWKLVDGCIEAAGGDLATKEKFGSFQLHLEWMAPIEKGTPWYNRGNNGLMLMGLYEIQIFDSYNEKIYPDGSAAAIYAQTPPLVNATRPPGAWQSYDVVFVAPVFDGDKLLQPARVTMLHNGLLVHLNQEIRGETGHRILPAYTRKISKGPVVLSGHDCPVRFRNIWIRPLQKLAE